MAQFIRLTSTQGFIGRFNVDNLSYYQAHTHSESGCESAGLEPCRMQTNIILIGMDYEFGCRETVEEIDRLINPSRTPG